MRPPSPGKVKESGGQSHDMASKEMKERFQMAEEGTLVSKLGQGISKSLNTYGSWSNREEEWYFTNRRFLFATKADDVTDQWIRKLEKLLTPEE